MVVAFFLTRLGSSLFKLRRLTKQSKSAFKYKGIDVRTTDENIPPATFGLVTSVILIPSAILIHLSDSELRMILEHEKHHIDRRDYVFNLLKAIVQSFLAFSPFIHKLAKTFVEDMELSCDAFVLNRGIHGAKDYGGLLLRLSAETRPRMDLVYSGLFVSNSFISRRITAMKSPSLKTRRVLAGSAFAFFAIVVGPAVASLGLDNAVESAIVPADAIVSGFAYEAKVADANHKTESASGTIKIQDGKAADFRVGALKMRITPRKVSEGWKLAIEVREIKTDKLVSSANIITDEKEGAQIRTISDDPKSDFRSISLSLSPVAAAMPKSGKSAGAKVDGDMVTLRFDQPTNIKDIIKTMAQVSGKNIILSRDIDATVQVVSQHPVSKDEAYKAFVSALELAGLTAVDEGKAIRIVKKLGAG